MIRRMRILNVASRFVGVTLAVFYLFAAAHATPETDAEWNKLIAEAIKHGGAETILSKTGSYVFAGPNGLSVTFTRRLDNKVRAVCAVYMSANINVCMNWESEKLSYATRADEKSPWIVSDVPPDVPESAPKTRLWLDLLSAFLDVKVPYKTFHSWRHRGGPLSARSGFRRGFSHVFGSGAAGLHR